MKRNRSPSEALWEHYRATGDPEARGALLAQYIGLVHHTVRQIAGRVGDAVEFDDLVGAGTLGLVRAFEGFDATRGLAFTTYATQRIRGAVLDELRAADWLPRAARAQVRNIQQVNAALAQRLGRAPRAVEVAHELGIELPEYWELTDAGAAPTTVSFDSTGDEGRNHSLPLADRIADHAAPPPGAAIEEDDRRRALREAIMDLAEQQRTVLVLCYDEGLTLRQIAEVLHVTESRVSQIRTAAIKNLRQRLSTEVI